MRCSARRRRAMELQDWVMRAPPFDGVYFACGDGSAGVADELAEGADFAQD